jgi:deoxyinosine 3'endonuclease (endonuclease V)
MKTTLRSRWHVTPREAVRLQQEWRDRVEMQDRYSPLQHVAGVDLAFDPVTNIAFAGVIVYRLPGLESAVRIVTQCVDGFRIPKPTREADHWVRDLRRAYQAQRQRESDSYAPSTAGR